MIDIIINYSIIYIVQFYSYEFVEMSIGPSVGLPIL